MRSTIGVFMAHMTDSDVIAYVAGRQPPADTAQRDVHLVECEACRQRVAAQRRLAAMLGAVPVPPVPEGLAETVLVQCGPRDKLAGRWHGFAGQVAAVLILGAAVGFGAAMVNAPAPTETAAVNADQAAESLHLDVALSDTWSAMADALVLHDDVPEDGS